METICSIIISSACGCFSCGYALCCIGFGKSTSCCRKCVNCVKRLTVEITDFDGKVLQARMRESFTKMVWKCLFLQNWSWQWPHPGGID